ncbi:hypothetical protein Agabi119p4_6823 [Agaricus bisporus var. burnettii]|uniref:DUF6534 domain-containing protein n=2 Tax=Agaricus bisporus var. burnettii TaxID=192524 RepID=A0A8H7F085_AGABI|nr:hypothetical protein Agabi119p4_6823 [Agaricus bisporus var. burnettii]
MLRLVVVPGLFFGVVFDLLLFGILTAQAYIYYISFPKDRALLKLAVVWVYLAGVAQTGLALVDFHTSSLTTVYDYSLTTVRPDHLWLSITALTAAVAIVIQSLYAYRIYLISGKRWLATMIICMSIGQLASGILGAFCYSRSQAVSTFILDASARRIGGGYVCSIGFKWLWGPLNIICDLTITICMVTFLIQHRNRTMIQQTRSHITKLVQIVVETGMASTILMVVYTVLFCLWAQGALHVYALHPFPGLMMSKVYSNSLLVLLNNRATIANGRNAVESFEFVEFPARGLESDRSSAATKTRA